MNPANQAGITKLFYASTEQWGLFTAPPYFQLCKHPTLTLPAANVIIYVPLSESAVSSFAQAYVKVNLVNKCAPLISTYLPSLASGGGVRGEGGRSRTESDNFDPHNCRHPVAQARAGRCLRPHLPCLPCRAAQLDDF